MGKGPGIAVLFVAKGLNGIKARSFQRRQHAADYADHDQNSRRDKQVDRRNDQLYVAGFSILGDVAVTGMRPTLQEMI